MFYLVMIKQFNAHWRDKNQYFDGILVIFSPCYPKWKKKSFSLIENCLWFVVSRLLFFALIDLIFVRHVMWVDAWLGRAIHNSWIIRKSQITSESSHLSLRDVHCTFEASERTKEHFHSSSTWNGNEFGANNS